MATFWYDTEFVERGNGVRICPVSIGLVRDDGAELYLINSEALSTVMTHPWCAVNLAPRLPIRSDMSNTIHEWDPQHPEYRHVMNLDDLANEVRRFLLELGPVDELWAYYAAYDHVVLAQLFGPMAELPSGIPMRSKDIMDLVDQYPEVGLPPQPEVDHHAMWDARWNHEAYKRFQPHLPERKPTLEILDAEVVEAD